LPKSKGYSKKKISFHPAPAGEAFGGDWVMTRADHTSGTDRPAEAARMLKLAKVAA